MRCPSLPASRPRTYSRLAAFALGLALIGTHLAVAREVDVDQAAAAPPPALTLPNGSGSTKFAVIGDMGTGHRPQYETAAMIARWYAVYRFEFVITVGDNMYGGQSPGDYVKKFEEPYKALLDAGVTFYAALGNHDEPSQVNYKLFNMNGRDYYTFVKGNVRFFALNSVDDATRPAQIAWFAEQLQSAREPWKIAYFHHPIYSSGKRHGPELDWRLAVEPPIVQFGVQVVFAGHEHFYERTKPQRGVQHFIMGSTGQLRSGNINRAAPELEVGFDRDRAFMLIEVAGDELHYQTLSRAGETVDSGIVPRVGATTTPPAD